MSSCSKEKRKEDVNHFIKTSINKFIKHKIRAYLHVRLLILNCSKNTERINLKISLKLY